MDPCVEPFFRNRASAPTVRPGRWHLMATSCGCRAISETKCASVARKCSASAVSVHSAAQRRVQSVMSTTTLRASATAPWRPSSSAIRPWWRNADRPRSRLRGTASLAAGGGAASLEVACGSSPSPKIAPRMASRSCLYSCCVRPFASSSAFACRTRMLSLQDAGGYTSAYRRL